MCVPWIRTSSCTCAAVNDPVCGCGGNEYPNDLELIVRTLKKIEKIGKGQSGAITAVPPMMVL